MYVERPLIVTRNSCFMFTDAHLCAAQRTGIDAVYSTAFVSLYYKILHLFSELERRELRFRIQRIEWPEKGKGK